MNPGVSSTEAQVVFIHVPKAAGTTFTAVLDGQFRREEICPAYYLDEFFFSIPREQLLHYRLLRGHYEWSVLELLRDVRVITVLREPVSRAFSYYRFIRATKKHPKFKVMQAKSFLDVLHDEELGKSIRNFQTLLFGRDLDLERMRRNMAPETPPIYPWENRPGPTPVSLERAKMRLAMCSFVGLQERFEDSLLLLAYTFGWPPPVNVSKLNVTPVESVPMGKDEEELVAIRDLNSMDIALYAFAADLFERRFDSMVRHVAGLLGRNRDSLTHGEIAEFLRERKTGLPVGQESASSGR